MSRSGYTVALLATGMVELHPASSSLSIYGLSRMIVSYTPLERESFGETGEDDRLKAVEEGVNATSLKNTMHGRVEETGEE